MTTGKTIALTRRTFVGKVMSLPFNMLSRLVITFLQSSKRLLISWLQSPSAVILEPKKIKSDIVATVSPSISHEVINLDSILKRRDINLSTKVHLVKAMVFSVVMCRCESWTMKKFSTSTTNGFWRARIWKMKSWNTCANKGNPFRKRTPTSSTPPIVLWRIRTNLRRWWLQPWN